MKRPLLNVVLTAILLGGGIAHAQSPQPPASSQQPPAPAQQDAVAEQRRALDAARENLRQVEERRKQLASEIDQLKGERGKLQESLIAAVKGVRDREPAIEERSRRISEMAESERQLRASLASRRGVLADVIAALQRMGRQPPPALLVRPNDALEAVRSAMLLGAVVPDMRAEAEALGSDLREMVRLKDLLTSERDTLTKETSDLEAERERLAALVEERQKQASQRETDLAGEAAKAVETAKSLGDLESLISKMEADQARAAAEAAKAQSQKPDAPGAVNLAALGDAARLSPAMPFEKARGLLPLPVSGKRISSFGQGDASNPASKGVSISAAPGAPVTAPCDAWVVYAGPFRSYGQLLILNAGDGYHVLLAGMERITVGLNQFVLAGEPVGTMRGAANNQGRSHGSATERPVLYVEFRKDRGSIDPSPWWAGTAGEKVGG